MIEMILNKVAILPLHDPEYSAGGIYIPDMARERCDQGIVKAIGPQVIEKLPELRPGDHVLYGGWEGSVVELDGEHKFIVMEASRIRAIIHPPDIGIVPGVFFLDREGKPFPATFETIQSLIADAIQESDWGKIVMGKGYLLKKQVEKGGY